MAKNNLPQFHFSRAQQLDIERASGKKDPGLVRALEGAVGRYLRDKKAAQDMLPLHFEQVRAEVKKVERAAVRFRKTLLDASEDTRNHILGWSGDGFLDGLHLVIAEAELWLRERHRAGPKTNRSLMALDHGVALALFRCGVRLTKGRDGRLAKCLQVVRDAVGAEVPEDIFPALSEAHRRVEVSLKADRILGWISE